ncbi:hypothetical protein, partial [Mariniflexile sp.]|uniref:hypothetical protein n=1 Tax=Mariniflexile sp. TaxID=1979402 RepID=UPI0040476BC1
DFFFAGVSSVVFFLVLRVPQSILISAKFALYFAFSHLFATFMCKERCVFECEDFPKENQMQANKATTKRLN